MSTATAPGAAEITRASKSNLALAFFALPSDRRADITLFYAWCRIIDDLADEPGAEPVERSCAFAVWRSALREEVSGEDALAPHVRELIAKYGIPVAHFDEIIAGCEMDIARTEYRTWEDLRLYCYRVASVVGLISIEIFGYHDHGCRAYAIELGLALQITNIIRDVGADWQNDRRLYLPQEEMARFGVTTDDLAAGNETAPFRNLLAHQAARADEHYERALAALPPADRRSMVAAEIMRTIYSRLLRKIRRGRFQVLRRRFRLSKFEKLLCIGKVLLVHRLRSPSAL